MANEYRRVGIFTRDKFLFQKVRLEFLGVATVDMINEKNTDAFDLVLIDADCEQPFDIDGIRMSRSRGEQISIPFKIGSLLPLLANERKTRLSLIESTKSALIGNAAVKLTELEYALLRVLLERKGEYTSREELLMRVWNGRADKGILNVYIHYLREKLEKGGEKIILSSRNAGYKINEIFLSEGEDA